MDSVSILQECCDKMKLPGHLHVPVRENDSLEPQMDESLEMQLARKILRKLPRSKERMAP